MSLFICKIQYLLSLAFAKIFFVLVYLYTVVLLVQLNLDVVYRSAYFTKFYKFLALVEKCDICLNARQRRKWGLTYKKHVKRVRNCNVYPKCLNNDKVVYYYLIVKLHRSLIQVEKSKFENNTLRHQSCGG